MVLIVDFIGFAYEDGVCGVLKKKKRKKRKKKKKENGEKVKMSKLE